MEFKPAWLTCKCGLCSHRNRWSIHSVGSNLVHLLKKEKLRNWLWELTCHLWKIMECTCWEWIESHRSNRERTLRLGIRSSFHCRLHCKYRPTSTHLERSGTIALGYFLNFGSAHTIIAVGGKFAGIVL